MTPRAPSKAEALVLAKKLKELLLAQDIPVENVFLFGSSVRGDTHSWSDIDVAIVHRPFLTSRFEERTAIRRSRRALDLRIETVSFRPEDFDNEYFALAREVKKNGIPV